MAKEFAIRCAHGAEDPERATIPFVMTVRKYALCLLGALGQLDGERF